MRHAVAAALCAALLCSCLSAPRVEEVGVAGEAQLARLDEIEASLAAARVSGGQAPGAAEELAALRKAKVADEAYRARVYALSGEAFLLAGDSASARTMLKAADEAVGLGSRIGARDPAPVLRALLVPDLSKRAEMLRSSSDPRLWGSDPDGVPARIQAELALLLAGEKAYPEAAAAMDSAYPRLSQALREAYSPLRKEIAQALEAGVAKESADIAEADPLPMGLLARALWLADPGLASGLGPEAGDEALLASMTAGGLILAWEGEEAGIDPGRPALRRDAVPPLFKLYVKHSGEKGLERRYTEKYAPRAGQTQGRSPVPDLAYGSAIFDAALALVEREIMDLPDGRLFMPDQALSGLAFLEMLARLPPSEK
jgi:hypothetical protein